MKKIAVIPGDGIGIDVTREAVKVLEAAGPHLGDEKLALEHFDWGAETYLKTGISMPPDGLDRMRTFDAILLGALGDPRIPDMRHAADILLGMRFKLDLFVNERPVRLLDARLTPLRDKSEKDIQFVVFRENTEGLYVGMGGNFKKGTPDEVAIQEDVNTRKGVERIIRHAFAYAKSRGLTSVVMADKSNVLTFGHDLWQRVFRLVAADYPGIEARHLYVDALVMQMVKKPEQFEVIVTCNMFGDIVTDLGAQLQGGLGMAASGNIHPGSVSLFEPVHGSAPKYAGKNVANPFGAILTAGMMLAHLGLATAATAIEDAVRGAIKDDETPAELGGSLTTTEVGDAVARRLAR